MATAYELLNDHGRAVQPLVYEYEDEGGQTAYSVAATGFLVGFKGETFLVTTRHGLDVKSPLCIFASDTSQKLLPLDDVFFVPRELEPEDFMDLALVRIDTAAIRDTERGQAALIVLAPTLEGWPEHAQELFMVGFPDDHTEIDYDTQAITTNRVCLEARRIDHSALPFLHEAKVSTSHTLQSFNGFSGSPVFAVMRPPGRQATLGLCGMALRGTSTSNIIHFLDRSVILDALTVRMSASALSR